MVSRLANKKENNSRDRAAEPIDWDDAEIEVTPAGWAVKLCWMCGYPLGADSRDLTEICYCCAKQLQEEQNFVHA